MKERTDTPTLVALALIGVVLIIFAVGTVLLALRELEVPEVMSTAVGAGLGSLATYLVQRRIGASAVTDPPPPAG